MDLQPNLFQIIRLRAVHFANWLRGQWQSKTELTKIGITACTITVVMLAMFGRIYGVGPLGPSNYNDCVLAGMKGVTSDVVAQIISGACAQKFPPPRAPECVAHDLSQTELARLRGNADIQFHSLRVHLYNGNPKTKITALSVSVYLSSNEEPGGRRYDINSASSGTPPFSEEQYDTTVSDSEDNYGNPNEKWNWFIAGGRGCSVSEST